MKKKNLITCRLYNRDRKQVNPALLVKPFNSQLRKRPHLVRGTVSRREANGSSLLLVELMKVFAVCVYVDTIIGRQIIDVWVVCVCAGDEQWGSGSRGGNGGEPDENPYDELNGEAVSQCLTSPVAVRLNGERRTARLPLPARLFDVEPLCVKLFLCVLINSQSTCYHPARANDF